jgi:hypothetical protein
MLIILNTNTINNNVTTMMIMRSMERYALVGDHGWPVTVVRVVVGVDEEDNGGAGVNAMSSVYNTLNV